MPAETRSDYPALIRSLSHPLEPQPLAVDAAKLRRRCESLDGMRAAMFDVYGTLVISGSGDVGILKEAARTTAVVEAFETVGLPWTGDADAVLEFYFDAIKSVHEVRRGEGADAPEVDVPEVWQAVLQRMADARMLGTGDVGRWQEIDCRQLAIEYEVRTNPTWPMPGLAECLQQIREAGLPLGIVSNAQFFTPLLFEAYMRRAPGELGFEDELQVYSFAHGLAKPGRAIYEIAVEALARRGIPAEKVVYLGNDMRNDMKPAGELGFRTALFAGDARSLRLREDDPGLADFVPDLVVTSLADFPAQAGLSSSR